MSAVVFVLAAFTVLLSYGAFHEGAVPVFEGMFVCAGVGLLTLVYFLLFARTGFPPRTARVVVVTFVVWVVAACQLIPLSPSLLSKLFSYRSEVATALDGSVSAPLSFAPAQSTIWLFRLMSCLLILLLARDLTWRQRERPFVMMTPVLFVAAWEAALGLVQFFSSGSDTGVRGTYVARAHFAGLLTMAIPIVVMSAVSVYQQGRKRFETSLGSSVVASALLAVAGAMFAAVILSLSRMGFLATLASLFFVGALSSWTNPSGQTDRRFRWLPVALTGALVIAAFFFLASDDLVARIAASNNGEQIGNATRAQIWKESLPLLLLSPWFGTGLGTYGSVFLHVKHVAPMMSVAHVHNDYIQGLAEIGILGFVPLATLTILALKGALDASARSSDSARMLAIGCAGSLLALMLHSFVDFNLYIPANALAICWIAGMSLGLAAHRVRKGMPRRSASVSA